LKAALTRAAFFAVPWRIKQLAGSRPRLQSIDKRYSLLPREITTCRRCDRLAAYCASFRDSATQKDPGFEYWANPVPGFGDLKAELLVIGLAPGAQGANRTGRPFTGDAAGEVLYRALFKHGFSNQPKVTDRKDGLELNNVYITNAVKCVPPKNRPTGQEKANCFGWLESELSLLKNVRVVLAMGKDAFDAYVNLLKREGKITRRADLRFTHGGVSHIEGERRVLVSTYHFSRYNMNTRVLTEEMVEALFIQLKGLLKSK
jgi:uracil-DNA glycosylase family 4